MAEPIKPLECNCAAIRQAARHVTRHYDQHMAQVGLRSSQFSILTKLKRMGPLGINALAAAMGMDRTTLGRNLRPLERSGLVSLEVDPDDRRSRRLVVTELGRTLLEQARPAWQAAQLQFEKSFGRDESAALRALLRTITKTRLAAPRRSSAGSAMGKD